MWSTNTICCCFVIFPFWLSIWKDWGGCILDLPLQLFSNHTAGFWNITKRTRTQQIMPLSRCFTELLLTSRHLPCCFSCLCFAPSKRFSLIQQQINTKWVPFSLSFDNLKFLSVCCQCLTKQGMSHELLRSHHKTHTQKESEQLYHTL